MLTHTMTGRRRHDAGLAKGHTLMFDESLYAGMVEDVYGSYFILKE